MNDENAFLRRVVSGDSSNVTSYVAKETGTSHPLESFAEQKRMSELLVRL